MIRPANINDENSIMALGNLLHHNFSKTYDIKKDLNNELAIILISINDFIIDGYIWALESIDYIDLLSIVVSPEKRNKKIGSSLLEELIKIANKKNKYIMLEVKEDNLPAIELYKKYNFKLTGVRKKYYDGVDAYILRRDLSE